MNPRSLSSFIIAEILNNVDNFIAIVYLVVIVSGYKTIWSVRGAKRAPENVPVAAQVGGALAVSGRPVVALDADPASARPLHHYFGIENPTRTLEDFLWGRVPSLGEAAMETGVQGLKVISGAGRFPRISDPAFPERQKLIAAISELDAEYFVVDIGESSSDCALDLFAVSAEGILVIGPEPASIQGSYNFLKKFVYRRLERLFLENPLISEIVREATDARSRESVRSFPDLCERLSSFDRRSAERALSEIKSYSPRLVLDGPAADIGVAEAFSAAVKTYLGIETRLAGAAGLMRYAGNTPSVSGEAGKGVMDVVRSLLGEGTGPMGQRDNAEMIEPVTAMGAESPEVSEADALIAQARALQETFGFNDNVEHMGKVYHVQTEAQGGPNANAETIVYHGGRIFFSKKTPYCGSEKESLRDFASRQHKAAMAAIRLNRIQVEG